MRKIIAIMIALLASLAPVGALAVEYAITDYGMAVDIGADGSASATETLVYEFDGEYNGILSAFDIGDVQGLEDLALFVDGDTKLRQVDKMNYEPFTYTAKREGRLLNVQAYAPGNGGTRTFRYEYRLLGLCQRYRDAARLNYKLIGTQNQVTLRNATVRVTLPGEVYDAWAHGAMRTDDIHWEGSTLVYGPADVPSGRFVEADILFDQASLPGATMENRDVLEEVRAQEAELAQKEQATLVLRANLLNAARYLLTALLAAFAVGCVWITRRLGRTIGFRKRVEPDSDPHALKGVKAAVAQWVYSGHVDIDGLTGTLLELLSAEAIQTNRPQTKLDELNFVLKNHGAVGLSEHQRYVLKWLFKDNKPLYADSLDARGDEQLARSYVNSMNQYAKLVKNETEAAGYLSGLEQKRLPLILLCVLGLLLSAGLFLLSAPWTGALSLLLTLALIVVSFRLRRLSDEGEHVYAALEGFVQRGGDMVASEDLLWLLPISAALGCLEPFFEWIDDTWEGQDDMYPHWIYVGWHHDMGHMQRGMNETWQHNHEFLSQNSSSDSSSGGGGGGGGHGAW